MSKGSYIGVSDKARKVKSIYVGVDGKARKIKKAYIGDANGKARLCWSGEKLPQMQAGTFTSTGTSYTISDLQFKPVGVLAVLTTPYSYKRVGNDIVITIPPSGGYLYSGSNHQVFQSASNAATYSDNSVKLTGGTFGGTYQYVVWGEE